MRLTIPQEKIREYLGADQVELPKYASILLNVANRYSQGTRPRVVGQMSDLVQEFPGGSLEQWEAWYKERHPEAVDEATDRGGPCWGS